MTKRLKERESDLQEIHFTAGYAGEHPRAAYFLPRPVQALEHRRTEVAISLGLCRSG